MNPPLSNAIDAKLLIGGSGNRTKLNCGCLSHAVVITSEVQRQIIAQMEPLFLLLLLFLLFLLLSEFLAHLCQRSRRVATPLTFSTAVFLLSERACRAVATRQGLPTLQGRKRAGTRLRHGGGRVGTTVSSFSSLFACFY